MAKKPKHIGVIINRMMKEQGLSQSELARKAGLTRQIVSSIIACHTDKPGFKTIGQLAVALGADMGAIYQETVGVRTK